MYKNILFSNFVLGYLKYGVLYIYINEEFSEEIGDDLTFNGELAPNLTDQEVEAEFDKLTSFERQTEFLKNLRELGYKTKKKAFYDKLISKWFENYDEQ